MNIGERIKALREKRGLTLEQVGEAVGVNKATVQRYETGNIDIKRNTAIKLARCLGTSPSYIMGWTDDPIPDPEPGVTGGVVSSPSNGTSFFDRAESADTPTPIEDDPAVSGPPVTSDALRIAAAYDLATEDQKTVVRLTLKEYMEPEQSGIIYKKVSD